MTETVLSHNIGLGEYLRKLRREQKISKTSMAETLNISVINLESIESYGQGRAQAPGILWQFLLPRCPGYR
ncbi:MAG TPA: hypothetical protein PK358_12780 [Spirochaetota bacterium]|nr:hypothetical protein [Spirochaetota bacterium]HPJ35704.1 hypothetical protein [Spirochaetota bacterium]